MKLYVYSPPYELSGSHDVSIAISQAHDAARRIAKNIEVDRERARLATAIQIIEHAFVTHDSEPGLLSGIELERHLKLLPRIGHVRLPFYFAGRGEQPSSFMLAPVPYANDSQVRAANSQMAILQVQKSPDIIAENLPEQTLMQRVHAASINGQPVRLRGSRHSEITRTLRANLRRQSGCASFQVKFVYKDGSISGEFPLGQVTERPRPPAEMIFNLALMSCRHFALDPVVDFCLLRNSEVDRRATATFRDQENLANDRTNAFLDRHLTDRGLHIRLFHTGLEPAIIGAYRAFTMRLVDGRPLVVTPVFFPDSGYSDPDLEQARYEEDWW